MCKWKLCKHFQLTFHVNYMIPIFDINYDKTTFVVFKLSCQLSCIFYLGIVNCDFQNEFPNIRHFYLGILNCEFENKLLTSRYFNMGIIKWSVSMYSPIFIQNVYAIVQLQSHWWAKRKQTKSILQKAQNLGLPIYIYLYWIFHLII